MLIGNVLEKTGAEYAWHLCADKLADAIRDIWLQNRELGMEKWEEALSEDTNALPGLQEEGFEGLVGLDYIFKWWGGADSDELAGEIDVIWKVMTEKTGGSVSCYRSWIKVAERDFILGLYTDERSKREAFRETFRHAFDQWKQLFSAL